MTEPPSEWYDPYFAMEMYFSPLFGKVAMRGREPLVPSLFMLLRDARRASGRDPVTGRRLDDSISWRWLGVVAYLIVLDNIGSCFRPEGVQRIKGNTIKRAIRYFSSLSDREAQAIYALRCALAHDYSLSNRISQRPELRYSFRLEGRLRDELLVIPEVPWDGALIPESDERTTIVCVPRLGDLVEEIVQAVLDLYTMRQLALELEGGGAELLYRYTMTGENLDVLAL